MTDQLTNPNNGERLVPGGRNGGISQFDIQDYVPYLLSQAQQTILPHFLKALKVHELPLGGWRILAALHKHGCLRVRDLLAFTGLEPPTLTRYIGALVERQLAERSTSEEDARGVLVQATGAGLALANELIPHALAIEDLALFDFSEDEKVFLIRLLKRISLNVSGRQGC